MGDVERPQGEADILVGMDRISLHPITVWTEAELRLMKSRFETGWMLVGILLEHPHSLEENANYHIVVNEENLPVQVTVSHIAAQPQVWW